MENGYLVPANTKKSLLWFSILRPFPDAVILGVGIIISVFLLIGLQNGNIWLLLLACLPMIVAVVLVLPIPNYHNTLVGIQSILNFYKSRRNYVWKGWCIYDELKDDK